MDAVLRRFIKKEIERQKYTLDLIPSENIADPEMLKILGSPLVNKYSEGYPGKRYYPGNEYYDKIENLAQERALRCFGLNPDEWHANVQPYSGSPANHAVYFALLRPGDVVMGLALSHGGHLTHGHCVNFSGTYYQSVPYGLRERTHLIDYDSLEEKARELRPRLIVSGATAYPRIIDFKKIGAIARDANAYHLADISHIAGLVAGGVHPSPFPHADIVTTTTHKTLRGPRGAIIFARKSEIRNPRLRQGFGGQAKSEINPKFNPDAKGSGLRPERRRNPHHTLIISEAIDQAVFPGLQGGPHNNQTAAIAWALLRAQGKPFKRYAAQVVKNAKALAAELLKRGFTLVSGGTDNHLMLLDLRPQGIAGMDAEKMLEAAGIVANRNTIPGDPRPFKPSGIRMGTPSITSRGMKEREMRQIAAWIYRLINAHETPSVIRRETRALCKKFPLPY